MKQITKQPPQQPPMRWLFLWEIDMDPIEKQDPELTGALVLAGLIASVAATGAAFWFAFSIPNFLGCWAAP